MSLRLTGGGGCCCGGGGGRVVGGQRQWRAAVVVGGRSGGDAHGGGQRVHVVRQERGGHGGLGVEIREPAGHHLTVMAVVSVVTVVAVVAVQPGVPVGETRRAGGPGHGRLRVLRRNGRHGGRGTPVVVRQAQQFLDGERRPLRHRLVLGGGGDAAHRLHITE